MPRFGIRTVDGEPLGERLFNAGVWEPGDRIPMPPGPTLVVVEVREGDPPVLVVRVDE